MSLHFKTRTYINSHSFTKNWLREFGRSTIYVYLNINKLHKYLKEWKINYDITTILGDIFIWFQIQYRLYIHTYTLPSTR